jgi:hypothetical protein
MVSQLIRDFTAFLEPQCLTLRLQDPASLPFFQRLTPVHTFPQCFFNAYFNIILPRTPRNLSAPPPLPHGVQTEVL